MRAFKVKAFVRFQRRERIANNALCKAIAAADSGIVDAELGGGLIKQRVARLGQGKSGGFRTIIAYRSAGRAVFLFGFAKSERSNIDADELKLLQHRGARFLAAPDEAIEKLILNGDLQEVDCGKVDKT